MKYKELYSWRVIETIQDGKQVYCTDREKKEVFLLNTASAGRVLRIINNDENKRYEFWVESEGEE